MKLIPEELKPPKISTFQFVGFNIISEDFFTCKNRFVYPIENTTIMCNCRDRNSGWLPAKTGSTYHLASSVDVKMQKKSRLQIVYLCKMIVLFSILKQLAAAVFMAKLTSYLLSHLLVIYTTLFTYNKSKSLPQRIYCVESCNYPRLQLFSHF